MLQERRGRGQIRQVAHAFQRPAGDVRVLVGRKDELGPQARADDQVGLNTAHQHLIRAEMLALHQVGLHVVEGVLGEAVGEKAVDGPILLPAVEGVKVVALVETKTAFIVQPALGDAGLDGNHVRLLVSPQSEGERRRVIHAASASSTTPAPSNAMKRVTLPAATGCAPPSDQRIRLSPISPMVCMATAS